MTETPVVYDTQTQEKSTQTAGVGMKYGAADNDYDICGACGGRRDEHIPGIGNTLFGPTCLEYRLENEKGQWVWVPEHILQAFEMQMAHYNVTHTPAQIRTDIVRFEQALEKQESAFFGDTDNCPLKHSFGDGIYVREIFIPQGTVLTGKIHKHRHPNFLMRGEIIVVTEGGGMEHLQGPLALISPPGTKRTVFALTDVWWITVHVTDETDLEKIEEHVIASSYEAYQAFVESRV